MMVRAISLANGNKYTPVRVDHSAHSIGIVYLAGDKNSKVVRDAYQAAIKHPMHRSRKSKSITDNVRPIRLHRPDVSRFDLCASTAIDKLQSSYGARRIIGL
jgi:hypothetical protein